MYPRSGFRSEGTRERTLVPGFRSGGTSAKTTLLENHPFGNPRKGVSSSLRPPPKKKPPRPIARYGLSLSFLSLVVRISLVKFKQGISLVIWVFSLVFPGFQRVQQGGKILGKFRGFP